MGGGGLCSVLCWLTLHTNRLAHKAVGAEVRGRSVEHGLSGHQSQLHRLACSIPCRAALPRLHHPSSLLHLRPSLRLGPAPALPSLLDVQGIAEVDRQYAGQDTVHFTDRLLFLVARKPEQQQGSAAQQAAQAAEAQAHAAHDQQPQQQGQQRAAVLTPAQQQAYAERGFTGPLTILSSEEAARLAQQYQQYAAALPGGAVSGDWRFKSHLLLPWVWELAAHPRLVAAVSEALGGCRSILCWSTDWFCKQPGDGAFTGWHQVSQAPMGEREGRDACALRAVASSTSCAGPSNPQLHTLLLFSVTLSCFSPAHWEASSGMHVRTVRLLVGSSHTAAPPAHALQDSTYVGLDPPDVVTAWLALTPANAANGCLHFLPGSHTKQARAGCGGAPGPAHRVAPD